LYAANTDFTAVYL